jgi:hypothetical protein
MTTAVNVETAGKEAYQSVGISKASEQAAGSAHYVTLTVFKSIPV